MTIPMSDVEDMDNVIAALEHSDRVCEIYLGDVPSPLLQQFAAVMQVPFPTLTSLELWTNTGSVLVLPNPLLGGYAPRLRTLRVDNLPIPVLRKLPLSSPDLVNLQLWKMSYVEPQTIVNCLAALTRLETFDLTFYFPPSRHHRTRRRPIPLTRVILPNLTSLLFKGDSEYLEDLVGQLSMPLLDHLSVILHNQLIFDMPQLPQFIRRTEKLKALTQANITFYDWLAEVRITGKTGTANDGTFSLGILCTNLDWQVASLAEVCGSCLHPLSTLEHLGIHQDRFWPLHWPDDMDNIPWLDLLRPFTTMKNLHLYKELTPRVVSALQELSGEGEIEVMPALECLLLEDPHPSGRIQEAIDQFVATRQLSGHPVAVRPLNGL
ncbi:hypothetical protein F5148DRAFT_792284 [Russula earlei]|uniref:Uncharacterized protein n=1 Tax=Russula earlei TaxID=71964 RepID=A0ACC0UM14_9AGAM|nr:hypothetical protein F5148DRAFT_792284 [Russula earlei]